MLRAGMESFHEMQQSVMAEKNKRREIYNNLRISSLRNVKVYYCSTILVFTVQESSKASRLSKKLRNKEGTAVRKEDFPFCLHDCTKVLVDIVCPVLIPYAISSHFLNASFKSYVVFKQTTQEKANKSLQTSF